MKVSKTVKNQTETKWWLSGASGLGNKEMIIKGYKFQLCKMKKC